LVHQLGLVAAEAVEKNGDLLLHDAMRPLEDPKTQEVGRLAVGTLVAINPDVIVPALVALVSKSLSGNKIQVSVEEFEIFLTPAGELFDQRVLESIQKDKDSSMNQKRESKAYSYKEQMEEIALRKELDEKKKREGTYVEPKLTPKQKEMLNTALEKEAKVRAEVAEVKSAVEPTLVLLGAAIQARPQFFASFISEVTQLLFLAFTSPITAKQSADIYFDLRKAVFSQQDDDDTLSQIIASVTTLIQKPSFAMEFIPKKAATIASAKSVLERISEMTTGDEETSCPLPTPAFNYAFTLLEFAVKKNLSNEEFVQKGCAILSEHAQLRGMDLGEETVAEPDDLHPKYLPR
jgi:hypothetical protein